MDPETFLTPRKIFQNAFNAARKSAAGNSPSVFTPTRLARNGAVNGRFQLLPVVVQTPPSACRSNFQKVVNPFESLERLHLPMIASPSIFHRPVTPRTSGVGGQTGDGSGQPAVFEWTIDEVSSLGQANFEPYESQFLQTPDTAREAKAQAAISAYFNEISVPSPVDCPLRNQKIILNGDGSLSGSFLAGRKSKRKRDGITQTVLSFPPTLPSEVEAMLAPYFNFHDNQQQTHETIDETTDSSFIDHDARDASLRRKLFNCSSDTEEPEDREDSLDRLDLRCLSPPPVSPELDQAAAQILKRSRCFSSSREIVIDPGDISISPVAAGGGMIVVTTPSTQAGDDRESFGALSPISKRSESPSPMKPGSNSTELPDGEGGGVGSTMGESPAAMGTDAIYRSTPERPKYAAAAAAGVVPMNCSSTNSVHHMSVELNDSHRAFKPTDRSADLTEITTDGDVSYEDNLLASSSQSSCSISISSQQPLHPTTPVRRHSGGRSRTRTRTRNRKNLSHSFLLYSDELLDEEEDNRKDQPSPHADLLTKELHRRSFSGILSGKENLRPGPTSSSDQGQLAKSVPVEGSNFYRMDSGFNEEETTRGSQETTVDYDETDVSMQSADLGCEETPSRVGRRQRTVTATGNFASGGGGGSAGDGQHYAGCSIRL